MVFDVQHVLNLHRMSVEARYQRAGCNAVTAAATTAAAETVAVVEAAALIWFVLHRWLALQWVRA